MKIVVKVKTQAKVESVCRINQPSLGLDKKVELPTYKVSVKAAPVDGKANEAVIKLLADYFAVSRSAISLISGQSSKQKLFSIE